MTDFATPFSAVLFDCDGVLVDSERITNGVLHEMLHELGWPISEAECVRLFVGRALKDEWPVILEHTGFRITEEWLVEFRASRNAGIRASLQPIPGAVDAVTLIATAYGDRIACVSGADRHKVEMQLALTSLDGPFGDRVFSGMEQPRSKPAPDVYLAAAAALGIDPATAAVVEDSIAGVTAGVAAGATVLGFAPGGPVHEAPDALLEAGAALTFASMAELPALVGIPAGAA
ncbi:HAD family phosphatase [Herbiconiux sp. 11R-BC]|uniref:HAD family hydrolase n=1 Tax=Herbiconiux sp. 11R-BC TaxID=3111637 RepID=UPI003C08D078